MKRVSRERKFRKLSERQHTPGLKDKKAIKVTKVYLDYQERRVKPETADQVEIGVSRAKRVCRVNQVLEDVMVTSDPSVYLVKKEIAVSKVFMD